MAVLAVMVWRLGTGPFFAGLEAVDGRSLLAAAAIFFLTTVCAAWRWTIVSRGLGVPLSLPAAVAAYYRAVFLNLMLPTGIAGDVHRGIRHGREVRDVGRALRAVAWERVAGQVVQVVLTVAVLLVGRRPCALRCPSSRSQRRRSSPGSCSSRGWARDGRDPAWPGCGTRS